MFRSKPTAENKMVQQLLLLHLSTLHFLYEGTYSFQAQSCLLQLNHIFKISL